MLLRLYNPILASHPTPPSALSLAAGGACVVPVGQGLGAALAPAGTGQSSSCPQPAGQCPPTRLDWHLSTSNSLPPPCQGIPLEQR